MDQYSDPQEGQLTPMDTDDRTSLSWISWFCSSKKHRYYTEVDEKFIEDPFNLIGLNQHIPLYKETLEVILDLEPDDAMYNRVPDLSLLEPAAELLYGLIHQRYILTKMGMLQMYDKYESGEFGKCPRVYCNDCHLLPCGEHDTPKQSSVRLYCPNCKDIYIPPNPKYHDIDGSHFGTTFPHLFFQAFPETIKVVEPNIYVAKLFGFRISELSAVGPRMQWLRMVKDKPAATAADGEEDEDANEMAA
ncbi:casein kinase 2 regulatory subunit [Mucor circinelloides]